MLWDSNFRTPITKYVEGCPGTTCAHAYDTQQRVAGLTQRATDDNAPILVPSDGRVGETDNRR